MDFLKKNFDRAKQTVEEKFGDAEVTDYEPEVQALLNKTDDLKLYTEKILSAVECMNQPDPSIRLLPDATKDGLNKFETLSSEMGHLGVKMTGTPLGAAMVAGEQAYSKIGAGEREYLAAVNQQFIIPVKRFLNEDLKTLDNVSHDYVYSLLERKTLSTRRLDMDSLKGKQAKTPSDTTQQDLDKAEQAFKDQQSVVKETYQAKIESQIPDLQKAVKALATAQSEFIKKQSKLLEEFAKKC